MPGMSVHALAEFAIKPKECKTAVVVVIEKS